MNTYNNDKMYESYSNEVERMQKCINELQQENQQLNGTIQTYDILLKSNVEENKRLKDNWDELKRWLCEDEFLHIEEVSINSPLKRVLDKMQELERGVSDEQR